MGILSSMLESKVSDKIVLTPVKIATDMVEILPEDVWNKDTKFLDHCCKSGVYLKLIYDKLMKKLSNVIENEEERSTHILNNQLYGLGMDEFCTAVSQRRLYGSMKSDCNIKHIKNYTRMVQGSIKKYKEELERAFGENMRFDVVISNPPYNRGMDLDFVNKGFDLSEQYCVMITPAKWQTAEADQRITSKMSYGEFREKLVPHMSQVNFYPDSYDIFNAELTGGVTYFILDKETHVDAKIINSSKLQTLINSEETRSILNGESLYNIGNKIIEHIKNYKKYTFKNEEKRYQVWTNSQFNIGGGRRMSGSGASDGGGNGGYLFSLTGNLLVVSTSRILDSTVEHSAVGASKCAFSSDDKLECESFVSWINTKFVRFLLMINASKLGSILTDYYFRFVPAPPSGKFDHIYTDEELYKAFNLPQKYIDVIEAVIKERN